MSALWKILVLSYSLMSYGQSSLTQEEAESEVIDYSNLKTVLKNDGLVKEKRKKEVLLKQIKQEKRKINISRYNYPDEDDFWYLMSEYWLVKNAQILKWDFPKPEYGIDIAFKQLLEKFGYYNLNYKIIIVNTPQITHFGLPAGKNRFIFVLSLPFMRSLDLTKVDISLVLLEDMIRIEKGHFISNLSGDKSIIGQNFYESKFKKQLFKDYLGHYSKIIFENGFNFQQQYETTKKMDMLLKTDPELWGAYFRLLKKIDRFIKTDLLYKDYLKIYPSPELQLEWLSPKKKVI